MKPIYEPKGAAKEYGETLTRPPQSWCYVDVDRILPKIMIGDDNSCR